MRRDPFTKLTQPATHHPTPPTPLDMIPRPRRRKRRRDWDNTHQPKTYKVPRPYRDRASAVRAALLGLAQQHQSTVDNVATALMRAALDAVRSGEIQLSVQPNPHGRKMSVSLEVVPGDGTPLALPKPNKRRGTTKPMVLSYRWSQEIHDEIARLATGAQTGAVVVVLLEAALERIQTGTWSIRPRPVALRQSVTVARKT